MVAIGGRGDMMARVGALLAQATVLLVGGVPSASAPNRELPVD
jgi:hypothetical protein